MRVHVYCASASASARQLVHGLREVGVEAYRRKRAPIRQLREGDVVVCWGASYAMEGYWDALNSADPINKLQELYVLGDAGVAVPPFSPVKPVMPPEFLPRSMQHQCGHDLLQGTRTPGFWTMKMDVVKEYRVHVANGKSIKVGQKRPRHVCLEHNGSSPLTCLDCQYVRCVHSWIRSYDGGWGIYYDASAREGFNSKGRELAKAAVNALGLQLAAVDLWKLRDGSWCVGEVNRRPALPEGSGVLQAYVKAVCEMVGVLCATP